jgi:hypothetical protein
MERLIVKNFLNIKEADIEIKKFNIIIGHERNTLSRLVYFFRKALERANDTTLHNNPEKAITKLFTLDFPRYTWKGQNFYINYKVEDIEIQIHHDKKIQATINESFKDKLKNSQNIEDKKAVYIPAEKSSYLLSPTSSLKTAGNRLLIAEDPDRYLFPKTQKEFIFTISQICNTVDSSALITTNSPYVLTAVNILLLANDVISKNKKDEIKNEIEELIGKNASLKFDDVAAYEIENGVSSSFLNYENKLLGHNIIDKATEELEDIFDRIIEIDLCKN